MRQREIALYPSVVLAVLAMAGLAAPAYGYTDPGSGLLLWQMMGAAFVGSLFYVRRILNWLRVGRKRGRTEVDD
jgi:hypothetical protein